MVDRHEKRCAGLGRERQGMDPTRNEVGHESDALLMCENARGAAANYSQKSHPVKGPNDGVCESTAAL